MKSKLKYPFLLPILGAIFLPSVCCDVHATAADQTGALHSPKDATSAANGGSPTKPLSPAGKLSGTKVIKAPDPATEFLVGAGLVALSVVRRRLRNTSLKD